MKTLPLLCLLVLQVSLFAAAADTAPAPTQEQKREAAPAPVDNTAAGERVRFAGVFGLSFAGASLGSGSNSGRKLGAVLGVQVESPLSRDYYLQFEALYFEAGYTQILSSTQVDFSVPQVKLPLIFKKKVALSPTTKLNLGVGPFVSLKLNSTASAAGSSADLNSITASTAVGLDALVGLEFFYNGDQAFFVDARYGHVLTNGTTTPGSSAYGRDIYFTIGLRGGF